MAPELAIIRSIGFPRQLRTSAEEEDFEQELVDQWCLALAATGAADSHVANQRTIAVEFARFMGRRIWAAQPDDADRFLRWLRVERRQQRVTIATKAQALARFFDFLISRYQGDIHALTGTVVTQPIDEFNRPAKGDHGAGRVPPPEEDVLTLFGRWREALPGARKYSARSAWTTWPLLCGDGPDCV